MNKETSEIRKINSVNIERFLYDLNLNERNPDLLLSKVKNFVRSIPKIDQTRPIGFHKMSHDDWKKFIYLVYQYMTFGPFSLNKSITPVLEQNKSLNYSFRDVVPDLSLRNFSIMMSKMTGDESIFQNYINWRDEQKIASKVDQRHSLFGRRLNVSDTVIDSNLEKTTDTLFYSDEGRRSNLREDSDNEEANDDFSMSKAITDYYDQIGSNESNIKIDSKKTESVYLSKKGNAKVQFVDTKSDDKSEEKSSEISQSQIASNFVNLTNIQSESGTKEEKDVTITTVKELLKSDQNEKSFTKEEKKMKAK